MVTVPANALIRSEIMQGDSDPRMPAILDDDVWPTWLGVDGAAHADTNALLKTGTYRAPNDAVYTGPWTKGCYRQGDRQTCGFAQ